MQSKHPKPIQPLLISYQPSKHQKIRAYQSFNLKESKDRLLKLNRFIQDLGQLADKKLSIEFFQGLILPQKVNIDLLDKHLVLKCADERLKKMVKQKKNKKNWSSCDLNILCWIISKLCQKKQINHQDEKENNSFWQQISSMISGTTYDQCKFKWLGLSKNKITQHQWTQEENQILIKLEKQYSGDKLSHKKWKIISQKLYQQNHQIQKIFRQPKQCREHFASFLNPKIEKGQWTIEQDIKMLVYVYTHKGQTKWCKMVKQIENRTQNAIKNRYTLLQQKFKKNKQNKGKSVIQIIQQYLKNHLQNFQLILKSSQKIPFNQLKIKGRNNQHAQKIIPFKTFPQIDQNTINNCMVESNGCTTEHNILSPLQKCIFPSLTSPKSAFSKFKIVDQRDAKEEFQ